MCFERILSKIAWSHTKRISFFSVGRNFEADRQIVKVKLGVSPHWTVYSIMLIMELSSLWLQGGCSASSHPVHTPKKEDKGMHKIPILPKCHFPQRPHYTDCPQVTEQNCYCHIEDSLRTEYFHLSTSFFLVKEGKGNGYWGSNQQYLLRVSMWESLGLNINSMQAS